MRKEIYTDLQATVLEESGHLKKIVTGHYTWVIQYDPEI
jgi:hypothetical protein